MSLGYVWWCTPGHIKSRDHVHTKSQSHHARYLKVPGLPDTYTMEFNNLGIPQARLESTSCSMKTMQIWTSEKKKKSRNTQSPMSSYTHRYHSWCMSSTPRHEHTKRVHILHVLIDSRYLP